MRTLLRHSLASAAAVLTIMLFALSGIGQASSASGLRLESVTGSYATARINLELFGATAGIGSGRWLKSPRAADGYDGESFMARLTTRSALRDQTVVQVAECTWSDRERTSAECLSQTASDEAESFVLTIERGKRQRDTIVLLDRLSETEGENPATVRFRSAA